MRRRTAIPAVALLLLASCSNAADAEPAEPPFKAASPFGSALETCSVMSGLDARLGDDGDSLILQGENPSGGLPSYKMLCILGALDMPDSVDARIGSTRALDGTQAAEWDDISASWTYHPDDGLNMILEFTP